MSLLKAVSIIAAAAIDDARKTSFYGGQGLGQKVVSMVVEIFALIYSSGFRKKALWLYSAKTSCIYFQEAIIRG